MATNGLLIGLQRFTPTICKQRKEIFLEEHANLIQDRRQVVINKCVLMGNILSHQQPSPFVKCKAMTPTEAQVC